MEPDPTLSLVDSPSLVDDLDWRLDVDGRSHDDDDTTGTDDGCPGCAAMHDELERASEALCVAQGHVRAQQSLIDACAPDSRCTERSMVKTASVDRLSAAMVLIKRQRECIEQMSDAAAVRSSVSDVAGGVKVAVLQDSTVGQHGGGLDVEMIHDMVRVCVVCVCVWFQEVAAHVARACGVSTIMSGPLRMCTAVGNAAWCVMCVDGQGG